MHWMKTGGSSPEKMISDNYTFYKSENMADEASQNRSESFSDPFEINNVWLDDVDGKKTLFVEVNQLQGCKESYPDKYEVIWSGIMLMIYPPQPGLFLKFNHSGCAELQENVTDTLAIDLYEVFGDKDFVDAYASNITIHNSSKSSADNDVDVNR